MPIDIHMIGQVVCFHSFVSIDTRTIRHVLIIHEHLTPGTRAHRYTYDWSGCSSPPVVLGSVMVFSFAPPGPGGAKEKRRGSEKGRRCGPVRPEEASRCFAAALLRCFAAALRRFDSPLDCPLQKRTATWLRLCTATRAQGVHRESRTSRGCDGLDCGCARPQGLDSMGH